MLGVSNLLTLCSDYVQLHFASLLYTRHQKSLPRFASRWHPIIFQAKTLLISIPGIPFSSTKLMSVLHSLSGFSMKTPSGLTYGITRPFPSPSWGELKYKNGRGAPRKFSKNTLNGYRVSFDGLGSNKFLPLRDTNYKILKQHMSYSVIFLPQQYPKQSGKCSEKGGWLELESGLYTDPL